MQIITLREFIETFFRDAGEFASIHGVDRNTVYRWISANYHASGDRSQYQLWKIAAAGGDQKELF